MNFEEIKELIRVFGRSKLDKLEIKDKDFKISMKKGDKSVNILSSDERQLNLVASEPQPAPVTAEPKREVVEEKSQRDEGEIIPSPMVGTFYAAPSPDSPPFVKAGDRVRKGQTLCILDGDEDYE